MKYLYAIVNILEVIFAALGFYFTIVILISVLSGEGTLEVNGKCFGKCPVEKIE